MKAYQRGSNEKNGVIVSMAAKIENRNEENESGRRRNMQEENSIAQRKPKKWRRMSKRNGVAAKSAVGGVMAYQPAAYQQQRKSAQWRQQYQHNK
jgi:hypothetical protein